MPSTIAVRRKRGFRPVTYSNRHREVAELLAKGHSQKTIALATGYSRSHVSRIAGMPETKRTIARLFAARAIDIVTTRRRRLAEFSRR